MPQDTNELCALTTLTSFLLPPVSQVQSPSMGAAAYAVLAQAAHGSSAAVYPTAATACAAANTPCPWVRSCSSASTRASKSSAASCAAAAALIAQPPLASSTPAAAAVSTAVSGALTAPTAAVAAAALTTAARHQQTSLRDSCRASQQPWGVTGI